MGKVPAPKSIRVRCVEIFPIPGLGLDGSCAIQLEIVQAHTGYVFFSNVGSSDVRRFQKAEAKMKIKLNVVVEGNVIFRFYHNHAISNKSIKTLMAFRTQLHTGFLESGELRLTKNEIDSPTAGFLKDSFPHNFQITFLFDESAYVDSIHPPPLPTRSHRKSAPPMPASVSPEAGLPSVKSNPHLTQMDHLVASVPTMSSNPYSLSAAPATSWSPMGNQENHISQPPIGSLSETASRPLLASFDEQASPSFSQARVPNMVPFSGQPSALLSTNFSLPPEPKDASFPLTSCSILALSAIPSGVPISSDMLSSLIRQSNPGGTSVTSSQIPSLQIPDPSVNGPSRSLLPSGFISPTSSYLPGYSDVSTTSTSSTARLEEDDLIKRLEDLKAFQSF